MRQGDGAARRAFGSYPALTFMYVYIYIAISWAGHILPPRFVSRSD